MSHPTFQIRRRRRLPHVQRASRSRPSGTFWLTYSRAVDWLRRNHGVIDKTVELLEIYPTLIQEMSLDALWEFLAPFVTRPVTDITTLPKSRPPTSDRPESIIRPASQSGPPGTVSSAVSNRSISSRRSHKGKFPASSETLQIPVISVTYASDDKAPELQGLMGDGDTFANRTPRVYLCCLCNHPTGEETLYRHVLHALQHDFYVKSGPCADERSFVFWDDISEADICVFLLDDLSLNTPTCFKSLCAACTLKTPILFLKDSKYSLPVPLPDIILQHNLGLESPELSRASTPIGPRRSMTPEVSHHTAHTSAAAGRSFSTQGSRVERSQQRAKQKVEDRDMVLCLLNGYRDALVFEERRHQECEKELRETVHKLLGTGHNDPISTNGSVTLAPKSSNTLRPIARSHRPRRVHRTSLGVPKGQRGNLFQQDSGVGAMSPCPSDEHIAFSLANTPSKLAIDIAYDAFGSSPQGSLLPPHTHFQRTSHSRTSSLSDSSTPDRSASVSSTFSLQSSSSESPSCIRSSSSRSFIHLHQFQQQLRQDRAHFLSSVSPISDSGDVWDNFQERQTVYLVWDKPRKEPPRLVKFPPSSGEEDEEEQKGEMTDVLSDTSVDSL
ncbi:hypothetical protein ACOMHN_052205 [Nucella lapillus]